MTRKIINKVGIFENHENNFSIIRLICAILVVWGHSFALAPKKNRQDLFFNQLTNNHFYSGKLAVCIFFFISGGLVVTSALRLGNPWIFLLRRFLRIYPALITSIITTSSIIFIIFQVSLSEIMKWITLNASGVNNQWTINGVFLSHQNQAINGALWSIPLEIFCYILIFIICLINIHDSKRIYAAFALVLIFYLHFRPDLVPLIGTDINTLGKQSYPEYSVFFLFGVLVATTKISNLSFRIYGFLALSCYTLFKFINIDSSLLINLAIVFSCLFLASIPISINLKTDFSYGIYLSAWPIAQLLKHFYPEIDQIRSAMGTLILSLFYSFFSWHLIEKPMISLGHKMKPEKQ